MRAVRILEAFERCVDDPDAKIDLERLLASCTPDQLEYIALLRSTGAVDDAAAAASLAMTTREIDIASAGLEAQLRKLVEG